MGMIRISQWKIAVMMVAGLLLADASNLSAQGGSGRNASVVLDHGWQFRQVKDGQTADAGWLTATVPGDVHLDLLNNKQIPDPFYRDNESKLQWIQDSSWEYRVNFAVTPGVMARSHVELVFEGLDATANVFLNGTQVLFADNMFRTWRVDAKTHLHAGSNQLRVLFPSPIKAAAEVAALDPWQRRTKTAPKTYVRKAAYEYGWDWGPTFVTSGIWRTVRLEAWEKTGSRISRSGSGM
jgi:beta-mannosidase